MGEGKDGMKGEFARRTDGCSAYIGRGGDAALGIRETNSHPLCAIHNGTIWADFTAGMSLPQPA